MAYPEVGFWQFKKGHSMFNNDLFDEYKTMWDHGPDIPSAEALG